MEAPIPNEIVFYQDVDIKVTQSRFITNSKTYAMRNISSVHLFEMVKSRSVPAVLMVIGVLMLFSEAARVAGLVFLGIGVLAFVIIKNEFAVRISTNSGEVNSVVSKDKSYAQGIVSALNDAIIHRG